MGLGAFVWGVIIILSSSVFTVNGTDLDRVAKVSPWWFRAKFSSWSQVGICWFGMAIGSAVVLPCSLVRVFCGGSFCYSKLIFSSLK